jgi:hypothetical protein
VLRVKVLFVVTLVNVLRAELVVVVVLLVVVIEPKFNYSINFVFLLISN